MLFNLFLGLNGSFHKFLNLSNKGDFMSNENNHRKYYHDGKEVPSCTTIIKKLAKSDILINWANAMGFKGINTKEYIESRAIYGTHCHKLFEVFFSGNFLNTQITDGNFSKSVYLEIIDKFNQLQLFFDNMQIEPIRTELVLEGSSYGGTLDMLAYNHQDSSLIIYDLKTSKAIRLEYWLQLMGYVQLIQEIYDLPIKQIGIILLSKESNSKDFITVRNTEDCKKELEIFNRLKDIYYLLNE